MTTPAEIYEEIEALRYLTTAQLKDKYREVFGMLARNRTSQNRQKEPIKGTNKRLDSAQNRRYS
jgi:hypothetical protein